MTSIKKIQANRRNSKKSSGAITSKGKAIVAQNAVKHGIFSKNLLLEDESKEEFQDLVKEFYDAFQPSGALETLFVERVISASWRLSRIIQLESALMDQINNTLFNDDGLTKVLEELNGNKLMLLSRYETKLENTLFKALKELRLIQLSKQFQANNNTSNNGFVVKNHTEEIVMN